MRAGDVVEGQIVNPIEKLIVPISECSPENLLEMHLLVKEVVDIKSFTELIDIQFGA